MKKVIALLIFLHPFAVLPQELEMELKTSIRGHSIFKWSADHKNRKS